MHTTQDQLPFSYIRKGVVKLKNDVYIKIMEVPSVNTQLMENEEQDMVRETYGAILNSLNFKIQFYKQSRLVDINEYIESLDVRIQNEKDELKKTGIEEYSFFVKELIRENSVQTRRDYVVISYQEESKKKTKDDAESLKKYKRSAKDEKELSEEDEMFQQERFFKKAYKVLTQREKVLEKQIRRLGVIPHILEDEEITELLYTTYNKDRSVYQSMKGKKPSDFGGIYVKREEADV
jgi:hypothetical protein